LVDQTIALMEQGVAAGMTQPRLMLRDIPRQITSQIVADAMSSPMLEAFATMPASIPSAEQTDLRNRAAHSYVHIVAPAFTRLHAFLVGEYLPSCRDKTEASALPDGDGLYAFNVRWHTTSDKTPQEIHEIGLAEVNRIHAEMNDVMASVGF